MSKKNPTPETGSDFKDESEYVKKIFGSDFINSYLNLEKVRSWRLF